MSNLIHTFGPNPRGRDFVVGDIHGCFDKLKTQLISLEFSPTIDRLFSVGDLIDRGPDCEKVLTWLEFPWFFPVLGNHEQFCIGVLNGDCDRALHNVNGGSWFDALPGDFRYRIVSAFLKLPVAIEILSPGKTIGITHAECPTPTWGEFTGILKGQPTSKRTTLIDKALWSRDKFTLNDATPIPDLDTLYVGHSPSPFVKILGNTHYLDNLAWGSQGRINRDFAIKEI